MSSTIFEFNQISQKFNGQSVVLNDISFSITQGKKIALLGNNGAGKSTLLLHFNGILKPTSGSMFFKEKEVHYSRSYLNDLRRRVGLVLQNPDSQLFSSIVEEDIMFGLKNLRLSSQEVLQRTEEIMEATGILDLKGKPTHFLSQGQKKKVALAGVLAMDPEVLLLDEPTAQLDPASISTMMDLLNDCHRQGKTILLTTHDVDFAYEWADEIMIISGGQLLFHGNPYDAFQDPELLRVSQLRKPWLIEMYDRFIKATYKGFPPKNQEELYPLLEKLLDYELPMKNPKKAVGGIYK